MRNPFRFLLELLRQPVWIPLWLSFLMLVNMASVAFWSAPLAKVIFLTFMVSAALMMGLYGLMAAYAEGMDILAHSNVGQSEQSHDDETTPLRNPEEFQFDLNLPEIAEVWRRGSVIASWLLDLTASALVKDPTLAKFDGRVSDSGEGRWTIKAAIDEAVPVPVLSTALYSRFSSRGEAEFADKLLSAMRFEFGGHIEKSDGK